MSPSLWRRAAHSMRALIDREQTAVHGFAWMATYVEALRQIRGWASRLDEAGEFGEAEALILRVAFGEYLAQLAGGIAMSQAEIVRPARSRPVGSGDRAAARRRRGASRRRARRGAVASGGADRGGRRRRRSGAIALDDPTLEMIRDQVRRFAERAVAPFAHEWHRADRLIPIEVIDELSAIGVFGMTLPEEHGGLGLGKIAMCVVSEELSRAYIGVGSLGTRSEIAGELIRSGGTEAQKARWLPDIASGAVLPTAVFTEPNTGSDLANVQTRAVRDGDVYRIFGAKTWITHAARADLMTLLARTGPPEQRLSRPQHVSRAEAARRRCRPVSGRGDERHRDPGARLSRHEGIRDRVRRLRGAGRWPARRGRGAGVQAADGDLRERPGADRRARRRGGAERARTGPRLRARTQPVRAQDRRLPAGRRTSSR